MKRVLKQILLIASLCITLQSCIFVAGAATGVAAIAVVYDHRSISNALKDTKLANKIIDRIRSVPCLRYDSHIEVTVFHGVALLLGETPNPEWRQQAEDLAKSVSGISRVYNQITIQGPASTLTKTSDSWITTKIKSQMLTTEGLGSSSIKVVTENGVVYLMGIVTHDQADIAADIARQVSGVQKVVKVFQYNG